MDIKKEQVESFYSDSQYELQWKKYKEEFMEDGIRITSEENNDVLKSNFDETQMGLKTIKSEISSKNKEKNAENTCRIKTENPGDKDLFYNGELNSEKIKICTRNKESKKNLTRVYGRKKIEYISMIKIEKSGFDQFSNGEEVTSQWNTEVAQSRTPYIDLQIDELDIKKELAKFEEVIKANHDFYSNVPFKRQVPQIKLQRIHYCRRYFACDVCYAVFPTMFHQRCHKRTHGDKFDLKKIYSCKKCRFHCAKFVDLRMHQKGHLGEKTFKCDRCDYTCGYLSHLKRHEMSHSGEKPIGCDECDYACIQPSTLKLHKMTHSGEKPFKCEVCQQSFTRQHGLKKHKVIHTGEKPFICDECDYKTGSLTNFKAHRLTHSKEDPLKCDGCDYTCKRPIHLKQHKMTHSEKS